MSDINKKAIADQKARDKFKRSHRAITPKLTSDANKLKAFKRAESIKFQLDDISNKWDSIVCENQRYQYVGDTRSVIHYIPLGIEATIIQEQLKAETKRLKEEMSLLDITSSEYDELSKYYDRRDELIDKEVSRRIYGKLAIRWMAMREATLTTLMIIGGLFFLFILGPFLMSHFFHWLFVAITT